MSIRLDHTGKILPQVLGVVTIVGVVLLFVQDAFPRLFPTAGHDFLAAFSLAMIAVAYLVFQLSHRPAPMEFAKAILLASAFLFWAANQFWPNLPQAGLFNDTAIGLFVLDVFLVISGWPRAPKYGSFAGSGESDSSACFCEERCRHADSCKR